MVLQSVEIGSLGIESRRMRKLMEPRKRRSPPRLELSEAVICITLRKGMSLAD